MDGESAQFSTMHYVPDLQCVLTAARSRNGERSVCCHNYGSNSLTMPVEGMKDFSRPQIPDFEGCVHRTRDGPQAVRGHYHRRNWLRMPVEGMKDFSRPQVPDFEGRIPRGRDGVLSVGGYRYVADLPAVVTQDVLQ